MNTVEQGKSVSYDLREANGPQSTDENRERNEESISSGGGLAHNRSQQSAESPSLIPANINISNTRRDKKLEKKEKDKRRRE